MTKEIKMGKPEVISGEEAFDAWGLSKEEKDRYINGTKKSYGDRPGLSEAFLPPAKEIYEFSEEITLPGPGIWSISVSAKNNEGHTSPPCGVGVILPPEVKVDTTPPVIIIEGVKDGERFREKQIYIKTTIYDDNDFASSEGTLRGGDSIRKISGRSLFTFQHAGITQLRWVATDLYGNKSEKTLNLYYEGGEQK